MRWVRFAAIAAFALSAAAAGLAGSLASPGSDAAVPESAPESGASVEAGVSAAPDLTATAELRRSFMAPGAVAIAVTNHGGAPVEVIGVELVSDSFAPLGIQEFDARVPPSEHPRDLITAYGEARCPDGLDSVAAPSTAVLTVVTEDGATHEVEAALPHPNGTLDRLLSEACAARVVAAAVDVALGELTSAEGGTLTGDLVLTPLAGAALVVTEVRGSVLFTIAAEPAEGGAGEALAVPLGFDAHRCDGHAVGDAKQPFGFTVWIAIDGGDPVATPIEVADPQRDALWTMLDRRCDHDD
ncbi:hypothetical protein AB0B28_08425 [Glycomyces sp. NPDC046736]|uniref:hypothetical protein n=1 Tax=Glycomyces sp. NPDC046736 TaxID=3155615 RepID=UPI0033C0C78D